MRCGMRCHVILRVPVRLVMHGRSCRTWVFIARDICAVAVRTRFKRLWLLKLRRVRVLRHSPRQRGTPTRAHAAPNGHRRGARGLHAALCTFWKLLCCSGRFLCAGMFSCGCNTLTGGQGRRCPTPRRRGACRRRCCCCSSSSSSSCRSGGGGFRALPENCSSGRGETAGDEPTSTTRPYATQHRFPRIQLRRYAAAVLLC